MGVVRQPENHELTRHKCQIGGFFRQKSMSWRAGASEHLPFQARCRSTRHRVRESPEMNILQRWNNHWLRSPDRRSRRRATHRHAPVEVLEERRLLTINIQFDYRHDTAGFFDAPARAAALERAASVLESRINDTLTAISPGGSNSWTAGYFHPRTGALQQMNNLSVPAGRVMVFVGTRNLGTVDGRPVLGEGSTGAVLTWNGSQQFGSDVVTRGQTGVNVTNPGASTDFAVWGGALAFTTLLPVDEWNFATSPPAANQYDFVSVAVHEMAHLLGFGLAPSFQRLVSAGNTFTGTASRQVFGGNVPLHTDSGHWAVDVASDLPGTSTRAETLLDPDFDTGVAKQMTDLDWAGLDDLGWEITPVAPLLDFGDAPDATAGTGPGNYNTRLADNGPRHKVGEQLRLGALIDADNGTLQNATATRDDAVGINDEDGIADAAQQLRLYVGTQPRVTVSVTNLRGATAFLYGWIDYNGDGVFADSERASRTIADGTEAGSVTLTFPVVPIGAAASTFARFRISTSNAAARVPTGEAPDGEVEDYAATITVTLDIDGNGNAELFTDGILIARYMAGFRGSGLIQNALGAGATRTTATTIASYLGSASQMLDVDGNGVRDLFTDGILIARFLLGFTGTNLTRNAIGPGATRTTAAAIEAHLRSFLPPASAAGAVADEPAAAFAAPARTTDAGDPTSPANRTNVPVSAGQLQSQRSGDQLFTDVSWLDDERTTRRPINTGEFGRPQLSEPVIERRTWLRVIASE